MSLELGSCPLWDGKTGSLQVLQFQPGARPVNARETDETEHVKRSAGTKQSHSRNGNVGGVPAASRWSLVPARIFSTVQFPINFREAFERDGVPGCAQRLASNKFLRFAESSQRVSRRREIHRHRTAQHAHGPAHLHLQVIMLPPVTDVPRRGAQTLRQGASASVPLAPPDGANSLRFWPTSIRPQLPDPSRQRLGLQRHAAAG